MENNIIYQFFFSFSRAEYALKASSFLTYDKGVKADWDKFIDDIKYKFNGNKTEELKIAIEYIKNNPPKKQVIENGLLGWEQSNNNYDHLVKFLNVMIRRVRNNLFHGGKLQTGFTEDASRDLELIKSAQIILKEMIELNDEVKHYYNQPINTFL
jgi:hypothetical protein